MFAVGWSAVHSLVGRDPVAEPGLPGRVLIRMELSLQQQDHRYLLRCAQRVLAAPVRAVNFAWDIEQRLDKRLSLVAR